MVQHISQTSNKSPGTGGKGAGKEAHLPNAEQDGTSEGVCGYCKTACGQKSKNCLKRKNGGGRGSVRGRAKCGFCSKPGHGKDSCWKKHHGETPAWSKNSNSNSSSSNSREVTGSSTEAAVPAIELPAVSQAGVGGWAAATKSALANIALGNAACEIIPQDNTMVCDTGASTDLQKSNCGAKNVRSPNSSSLGYAGEAAKSTSDFDIPGQFVDLDGALGLKATLGNCSYNKNHNFNLCSLARLLANGWFASKGNTGGTIIKNRSREAINFDTVVQTPQRSYLCMQVHPNKEAAALSTEAGTKVSIAEEHSLLWHDSEVANRLTTEALGWEITHRILEPHKYCAEADAKQKNTYRESQVKKATKSGGRIFLDLSEVTVRKTNDTEYELNNKHWKTMVGKATGKKQCDFTKTNSEVAECVCEQMDKMKARGILVKEIWLDPVGKNAKLEKRAGSEEQ